MLNKDTNLLFFPLPQNLMAKTGVMGKADRNLFIRNDLSSVTTSSTSDGLQQSYQSETRTDSFP